MSLVLALTLWFYIVNELNKGTEEERQLFERILPTQALTAKKLPIRPIFVGRARWGYSVMSESAMVAPQYCIVVGPKALLDKIRYAYTMPVDVAGASKAFTASVPLSPIAPGIYMEETLVQVTVPVGKR
jgi:hypothetical protein